MRNRFISRIRSFRNRCVRNIVLCDVYRRAEFNLVR